MRNFEETAEPGAAPHGNSGDDGGSHDAHRLKVLDALRGPHVATSRKACLEK
jgi:hypothetical protein